MKKHRKKHNNQKKRQKKKKIIIEEKNKPITRKRKHTKKHRVNSIHTRIETENNLRDAPRSEIRLRLVEMKGDDVIATNDS